MAEDIHTVADIIKRAGGAKAISERLEGRPSEWAVYKWPVSGIPDRYWPAITKMANVSVQQLFAANQHARKERAA